MPVTAGAICSASQSVGTDLVPTHNSIVEGINHTAMVVMDETGWRVSGEGAWLWAATTKEATACNLPRARGFRRSNRSD